MAIPDYQTIMLPLLKLANDGQEHFLRDAVEMLAEEFGLTEEERKELLPSGQQAVFVNRVGWARTYSKTGRIPRNHQTSLFSYHETRTLSSLWKTRKNRCKIS